MAKQINFMLRKCVSKLIKNPDEYMNKFFRKNGIKIGGGCHIFSNIISAEPFLIEIGNGVTISSEVAFVTHDNSIIKIDPNCYNLFGKIVIGDNCFIGQRSTLLYGVNLANNIIVAAGSVVTHSFDEERIIIGGNPAKKITTWDSFYRKNKDNSLSRKNLEKEITKTPEKLIKRGVIKVFKGENFDRRQLFENR